MNLRFLPNAITLLRILLVAPLALLILAEQTETALWLFLLASISDGLDGWLARRFHWESELGGYLDPIADKLLMLATYVPLALLGWLPMWFAALIVLRDVVIVSGAFAWHYRRGPLKAEPLLLGRLNTVLQMLLVVLVLASRSIQPLDEALIGAGVWLVTFSTVFSGLLYVMLWAHKPGNGDERA